MRSGEKIKLTSYDELLGGSSAEATEIEISTIHSFQGHPFKVVDDSKMEELAESIRSNGVLSPVLLRETGGNQYEMISGHRRMYAAQLVGLKTIPAIIRDMTDDEATIIMVDSNIQREELLPSERAYAYKMRLEAMKHQGMRTDLTCSHDENKSNKKASTILGEQVGISAAQVARYIRLTELIPELLDMVDKKRLTMTVAIELSYLDVQLQTWVNEYMKANGTLKLAQIKTLREYRDGFSFTREEFVSLLKSQKATHTATRKVTLSRKKLDQYFPPEYTQEEMECVIEELLGEWRMKFERTSATHT